MRRASSSLYKTTLRMDTHRLTPWKSNFFRQPPAGIWHRNSSRESGNSRHKSLGHALGLSWNYTGCFRKPRQQVLPGVPQPEPVQHGTSPLEGRAASLPRELVTPLVSGCPQSLCLQYKQGPPGNTSRAPLKAPAHIWWAVNAGQLALETATTTAQHKLL